MVQEFFLWRPFETRHNSVNHKDSKNYGHGSPEFRLISLSEQAINFPSQTLKTLDLYEVNDILAQTFLTGETHLMTKAELVEKVAAQINLTKKQTEVVVNTVFQSITESLSQGKKVELRGFGSFRGRSRNARIGRNPKSGDRVDVPAKRVPFFKAGKELRELVDGELDISTDSSSE